jgi:putative NADPH-quinone reductase
MTGHNQMKRTILEFCGIKPVKVSSIGPVKNAPLKKREKWLAKAHAFGKNT